MPNPRRHILQLLFRTGLQGATHVLIHLFSDDPLFSCGSTSVGQPWLVNRLGTILTINIKPETIEPITTEDVGKAIDILLYEENSHFDNITEKAQQYKETFINIVFDGVEYIPGDEEQSLLLTHGLIKAEGKNIRVSNPIYKKRFTKTFFRESGAIVDVSVRGYFRLKFPKENRRNLLMLKEIFKIVVCRY